MNRRSRFQVLLGTGGSVALVAVLLVSGDPRPIGAPHGGPDAPAGRVVAGSGVDASSEAFAVLEPVHHDVSRPLRSVKPELTLGPKPDPAKPKKVIAGRSGDLAAAAVDPVLQAGGIETTTNVSAPIQNFEGVSNRNGVLPPDTNGDVGPNHYMQWVNLSLAVYSKTGTLLYGPTNGNTIFSGMSGPCATHNNGDPIVLYDREADRWMVSQFALPGGASGYHQCIAVSTSPDPTGTWYRYDFLYSTTKMNDYPHFGVWPDGYYMAVNQFLNGTSWSGQGVAVFERDKMLAGQTARMVKFDLYATDPNLGGMLPADIDGATPPPAGAPNAFMEFDDDAWGYSGDQLQLWDFHVDWANPTNSTFTKTIQMPTAAFDSNLCGYARNCIPQAGTTTKLDSLADRLMYRMQYRNFGTHQMIVVNHSVDVNGADRAGIRWYELRNSGAGWSIFQQGTYSPDSNHRWMGSAAMNGAGGIAIGYSVSSSTMYPSIRYTGRVAGDPSGTLPQGEGTIIVGTGAQTHTASRWGDYSMLAVDPVDDCTFWFTTEYVATTGSAPWQTRIASFTLPDCGGAPPTTGSISGHVTDSATGGALAGATVVITGGPSTTTDALGAYSFGGLAAGSYDLTASKVGYVSGSATGVVVTAGSTTTRDFALAAIPTYTTAWTFATTSSPGPGGDGNGYETNRTNLFAIDGLLATDANSGTGGSQDCTSAVRDKEDLAGFNLGLPSGAAVKGIEVQLRGQVIQTASSPKFCVLLSWNGGLTWTTGKATPALKKTLTTYTLGTAVDPWGRSWASADFGSSFRIRIVDLSGSTARTFSLDGVAARVTYQ